MGWMKGGDGIESCEKRSLDAQMVFCREGIGSVPPSEDSSVVVASDGTSPLRKKSRAR